ncbi:MAG: hypothetical protein C6P35_05815 [Cohnella sp.]|uniref:VanZ family protein n=1 Tax=Cohnella sp. TaxID=1883426 RepID=UPI000E36E319|nr:VanZ family protein [Cohnella sp.]REK67104.1 MAG: hypothetical protein C6P35_05815 [Cohnella sp.]
MSAFRTFIRRYWRWLPALICMAAIFILSSRTGDELDTVLPWAQMLFPGLESFDPAHYVAYFALALCFAYGFGFRRMNGPRCALIVLMSVAYGLTDEWHQTFVPKRTADPSDLLHDAIGAAAAAAIVYIGYLWRAKRQKADRQKRA